MAMRSFGLQPFHDAETLIKPNASLNGVHSKTGGRIDLSCLHIATIFKVPRFRSFTP